MGYQRKGFPIEKNDAGRPEIHYTRIYRHCGGGKPMAASTGFCRLGT